MSNLQYELVILGCEELHAVLLGNEQVRTALQAFLSDQKTAMVLLTTFEERQNAIRLLEGIHAVGNVGLLTKTPFGWQLNTLTHDQSIIPLVYEMDGVMTLLSEFQHAIGNDGNIVLLATDAWSLQVLPEAALTFYLGPREGLKKKHRNTVPLIDQNMVGLLNILQHSSQIKTDRALTYRDILQFPARADEYYRRLDTPISSRDKALEVAHTLTTLFPEIRAVFGGGYPFYLVEDDDLNLLGPTPPSILKYLEGQSSYFRAKTCEPDAFKAFAYRSVHSPDVFDLGIEFDNDIYHLNQFDQFEKFGVKAPSHNDGTLQDYFDQNFFDLRDDIWPCQYCTHFFDQYKFPNLPMSRGFNEECLPCNQTSLSQRIVMDCSSDIDLIVAVNGEDLASAQQIESYIRQHPSHFIHDSRPQSMILDYTMPLDIFVVNNEHLAITLDEVAGTANGEDVRLSTLALWLPMRRLNIDLGANFAMAFEPLYFPDVSWISRFHSIRRTYAKRVEHRSLVRKLHQNSLYLRQLVSNPWIVENLAAKLGRWRSYHKSGI